MSEVRCRSDLIFLTFPDRSFANFWFIKLDNHLSLSLFAAALILLRPCINFMTVFIFQCKYRNSAIMSLTLKRFLVRIESGTSHRTPCSVTGVRVIIFVDV